jgi:type VI secretion system protein VasG
MMRDGEGRTIDFRNTVIVMTSNLGADAIAAVMPSLANVSEHDADTALMQTVQASLVEHFAVALLARFKTIIYRPLSEMALLTIVQGKIDALSQRIMTRFGLSLMCDTAVLTALVHISQSTATGARAIDQALDHSVLPLLSQWLLTRHSQGDASFNDQDKDPKRQALRLSYCTETGFSLALEHPRENQQPHPAHGTA